LINKNVLSCLLEDGREVDAVTLVGRLLHACSYDNASSARWKVSVANHVVACQGDFDPRRTKVLQYTFNPFSVAQRKLTGELDQLREENRRLTKRLEIVEQSPAVAVGDLSTRVDRELHSSSSKEVEGVMAL